MSARAALEGVRFEFVVLGEGEGSVLTFRDSDGRLIHERMVTGALERHLITTLHDMVTEVL